jgi:hypothetical protein
VHPGGHHLRSVLNVWKRVEQYARDGFTALIHGKYYHEETRATASQALKHPRGATSSSATWTEGAGDGLHRGAGGAPLARGVPGAFPDRASDGFDPDLHLQRIGVANQTTMLAGESLAIAAEVGKAIAWRTPACRTSAWDALPFLRHHLLGDAGTAGRGREADGRSRRAAGRDGGHRWVQLVQHQPPGRASARSTPVTYHVADAGASIPTRQIRFKPNGTPDARKWSGGLAPAGTAGGGDDGRVRPRPTTRSGKRWFASSGSGARNWICRRANWRRPGPDGARPSPSPPHRTSL